MAGLITGPEDTTYVFGHEELKRILCRHLGIDWRDRPITLTASNVSVAISARNLPTPAPSTEEPDR